MLDALVATAAPKMPAGSQSTKRDGPEGFAALAQSKSAEAKAEAKDSAEVAAKGTTEPAASGKAAPDRDAPDAGPEVKDKDAPTSAETQTQEEASSEAGVVTAPAGKPNEAQVVLKQFSAGSLNSLNIVSNQQAASVSTPLTAGDEVPVGQGNVKPEVAVQPAEQNIQPGAPKQLVEGAKVAPGTAANASQTQALAQGEPAQSVTAAQPAPVAAAQSKPVENTLSLQAAAPVVAGDAKRAVEGTPAQGQKAGKSIGSLGDPLIQEADTEVRLGQDKVAQLASTTAKPVVFLGQDKPQNLVFDPAFLAAASLDAPDRQSGEPLPVFSTEMSVAAAKASAQTSHADASPKTPVKPFAEALMAQVKSVEVGQGRTTVHLVPRGLGNIEVEVIGEKDAASKVVVRVENPAVLQALRDDRQMLADAIGVSDSSIFDFQERGAGEQSQNQRSKGGSDVGVFGEKVVQDTQREHLDVVGTDRLDILT